MRHKHDSIHCNHSSTTVPVPCMMLDHNLLNASAMFRGDSHIVTIFRPHTMHMPTHVQLRIDPMLCSCCCLNASASAPHETPHIAIASSLL